jgi:hypothetical protein
MDVGAAVRRKQEYRPKKGNKSDFVIDSAYVSGYHVEVSGLDRSTRLYLVFFPSASV